MARPRATLALAVGLLAGVAYAVINRVFDVRTAYGTLPSPLAPVHAFVDQVLPLIAGALLGLAAHYVRLRAALARDERARVEELEARLRGVERDQAAWVLAASVLHEVRNPLHALGLVLDELGGATDAERATLLLRAEEELSKIDLRIGELRRLPSGAATRAAPVPLDELVAGVTKSWAAVAERSGIALSHRGDPSAIALADAAYVRVIVENLVQNALESLRARGKGGAIQVSVRRKGDRVELAVEDDGPGPDPEARKTLFEPVVSAKERGLGLGLSIARALARAMEGELTCGEGSTFRLELPGAPA